VLTSSTANGCGATDAESTLASNYASPGMGLVLDLSVSGTPVAAIVNVNLGITEPGMQRIFSATAERAIRALPGVIDVAASIDHGYVWDPDAVTAVPGGAARAELLSGLRLQPFLATRAIREPARRLNEWARGPHPPGCPFGAQTPVNSR
jgi:hypothetical protein